ncbi:5'-methylthioadenosine/S-adenosylhomocysteine nucleosidase [Macrococcus equipercicus]|uniref:5'-methylthioadenosine/S-adenosylhomocysteine nucleosidase n=1 Tax=Macrococcus equipercicus TaxID=69967 RepID=A0A9Q9BRY3_9STAP|nr:5'-methylthioadenosine/S-adenosylhomocysteine nucleosidase [Macrococcus equipercicus]KAA1040040.1 5'-methylthioadenosine/S-adenosylhomocysteine nucleosidase [Macrococcus equipercicus]UTH13029.1 5'-methylthioadenosine/S-adenosylhomocysteine nucleosidase [Macrococcus equipercicus]
MLGIIGAMQEEVAILKNDMQNMETIQLAHVEVYTGNLYGQEAVLMQSGIGKVNAAICTTLLIDKYQPDAIINTGSAGGLGSGLAVGDIVISRDVLHHDVDATEFGYARGQVPGMPLTYEADERLMALTEQAIVSNELTAHIGLIVSGDSFIGTSAKKQQIINDFPEVLAVEMEAAAVAQVCHQYKMPFIITRAVSDLANGEAGMTFDEFLEVACVSSSKIVKSLIEIIAVKGGTL